MNALTLLAKRKIAISTKSFAKVAIASNPFLFIAVQHSAVYKCKRIVLKDGRPLHMVKFVGAARNYSESMKNVMINVEDSTGFVWMILWWKQNECTAAQALIHKCNGNGYICVIGEVTDYYGVHKIMAFDVHPVSSGNEAIYHFLEVAYLFKKMMDWQNKMFL